MCPCDRDLINAYGRKFRLGHGCVIFCPYVLAYVTATLCTPETMEHPAASGQLLLINDNVVLPVLCTDILIMMIKYVDPDILVPYLKAPTTKTIICITIMCQRGGHMH